MRAFPPAVQEAVERYANVVVRTDHSDEDGWLALLDELAEAPEGWDDQEVENVIVDDLSWSGATPDEILEVVRADEYLAEYMDLILIADTEAVTGDEHLVLVVAVPDPDEEGDESAELVRRFRSVPREAYQITVNVGIGNMSFAEFAAVAVGSPERVFRGDAD